MHTVDPLHLMRLHVETLFTHDAAGSLLRVNEPGGAPAPRAFLGVTEHGMVRRYRHDVDDALRTALEAISAELTLAAPPDPEPYERILVRAAPLQWTSTGPAFGFPNHTGDISTSSDLVRIDSANAWLLSDLLAGWVPDADACQPMLAIVLDGRAVSLCGSVRRNRAAYEAGVETAASYRGRGLAQRAVAAWAGAVRAMERVPLYSTSWQNDASRAVARKLGLIHFGNDVSIA